MGLNFLDQYSYLHFASGIVVYFWGLSLKNWIILHLLFEILENTQPVINFINRYLTIWPGGKPHPDSFKNSFGDCITSILGWLSAYYLDQLGNKFGWYKLHIKK